MPPSILHNKREAHPAIDDLDCSDSLHASNDSEGSSRKCDSLAPVAGPYLDLDAATLKAPRAFGAPEAAARAQSNTIDKLKRGGALLAFSTMLAASAASVDYALNADTQSQAEALSGALDLLGNTRRSASNSVPALTVPLHRYSKNHVGIRAVGSPASNAPKTVGVLLDTGSTVSFLTREGLSLLEAQAHLNNGRNSSSFAGSVGKLFPISAGVTFALDASDPNPVNPTVKYHVDDRLFGSAVVASPNAVAPAGGAVKLDLLRGLLTRCESASQCLQGEGWRALSRNRCDASPELYGIDLTVGGTKGRFLLDTGAPSLISRSFYRRASLAKGAQSTHSGELVGAGGASHQADKVVGKWSLRLGADNAGIPLELTNTWVVQREDNSALNRCFEGGSLGVDAFSGCEVVLLDDRERSSYLRCLSPNAQVQGRSSTES